MKASKTLCIICKTKPVKKGRKTCSSKCCTTYCKLVADAYKEQHGKD